MNPRRLTLAEVDAHLEAIGCTCDPDVTISRTALLVDHEPTCTHQERTP